MADIEVMRAELARLASSPKSQRNPRDLPCEWVPQTVRDPRSGDYFTRAGAWEFAAERLLAGDPLEVIELDCPPGKKGYVLKSEGCPGRPFIYIKLQIGSGAVYGRSFHEDHFGRSIASVTTP